MVIAWLTLIGVCLAVASVIYGGALLPALGPVVCILAGVAALVMNRRRPRPTQMRTRKLEAIAILGGIGVGVVLLLWRTPPLSRPGGLVWIGAGCICCWVIAVFPYLRLLRLQERGERVDVAHAMLATGPGRVLDYIVFAMLLAIIALYMVGTPATMTVAVLAGWLIILLGLAATFVQLILYLPGRRPSLPWAGRAWSAAFGVIFGLAWVGWPIPEEANRWLAAGWLMIGFSIGVSAWMIFMADAVRKLSEEAGDSGRHAHELT